MQLAGIGCVVTGASSGIGRAVALELARHGCRVALLARRRELLESIRGEIDGGGGEAASFPCDITEPAALADAVDAAAVWSGGLRLAVVNAGLGFHGAAETATPDRLREVVITNLVGSVSSVQAVLPHLRRRTPSALVAVGSVMGLIPIRGGGTYGASKAGFFFYLRALRLELAGAGVRIGWVCPGAVSTEMFEDLIATGKLPRLSRWLVPTLPPERVARAVTRMARRGDGQRVIPAMAAFFAAFARIMPRTAERVLLLTGAGDL